MACNTCILESNPGGGCGDAARRGICPCGGPEAELVVGDTVRLTQDTRPTWAGDVTLPAGTVGKVAAINGPVTVIVKAGACEAVKF